MVVFSFVEGLTTVIVSCCSNSQHSIISRTFDAMQLVVVGLEFKVAGLNLESESEPEDSKLEKEATSLFSNRMTGFFHPVHPVEENKPDLRLRRLSPSSRERVSWILVPEFREVGSRIADDLAIVELEICGRVG